MTSAYPPVSAAAPSSTNAPARVGLILAIIAVAFGVLVSVVNLVLPIQMSVSGLPTAVFGVVTASMGLVSFLLSIATLILGIVGAFRRGPRALEAGIALGVGTVGVFSGFVGLIAPLVFGLAYGF